MNGWVIEKRISVGHLISVLMILLAMVAGFINVDSSVKDHEKRLQKMEDSLVKMTEIVYQQEKTLYYLMKYVEGDK